MVLVAQALNGMILPIVAIVIFIIVNRRRLLGDYVNNWKWNVIGGLVVAVITFLGGYSLVDSVAQLF